MKQNLKTQNITQLIIALVIILFVNYISSNKYFRLDLTTDKRYTLTDATNAILNSLNDVVYIEIYLDGKMPIDYKRMNKSIEELMDEFRVIAGSNIKYQFVNPSKSNDESKRNAIYQDLYERGLNFTYATDQDEEGGLAEKILFPGAFIRYKDFEIPLNLLRENLGLSEELNLNNSIQSLEYEFVNAISKIITTKRKKIAFVEGQGELDEFYTGDITGALNEYYDIDRVTIKEYPNILDPYDAVIIAGPTKEYTEKSKFIVDQYIMNGGKVLWFVESVNISMDSLSTGGATFALMNDINLGDQLFKYGVRINPNIIQDYQCAVIPINTAIAGAQPKFVPASWLYFPLLNALANNPITKNLNMIKSEFPSVIDLVGKNSDVKSTTILSSSVNSKVLNVPLLISLDQISETPDPITFNQANLPIGVILEGQFESVFKNRSIKEYTKGADFDVKEKSESTRMIVVSDVEIIKNEVKQRADGVFVSPLGYDRYTKQTYGNKEFVMNAVHYLVDESGILDIRSREFKLRTLDKSKVQNEKTKWKLINTVLPIGFILLFAVFVAYIRKRKYTL
jgi:gliding-associated putative ABC transporter substrate-binding component GldG